MYAAPIIAWKQAPFLRLLIPFCIGITTQFYTHCPPIFLIITAAVSASILICLSNGSLTTLFKYKYLLAYTLLILLATAGAWRMHAKTASLKPTPIAHIQDSAYTYIAALLEPVTEKANSYKTIAQITHQVHGETRTPIKATIILYLQKTSISEGLYYGDKIVFRKQLHPVKGAENPGGFNYKSWCEYQGIFYQTYLAENDFKELQLKTPSSLKKSMFLLRDTIVNILRRFIPGNKEAGLAEALLIGYKVDLDKSLIQSYSNTGVIHVIAISGLHLGLIYMLLTLICKPLGNKKWTKIFRPAFIIAGLWAFGFLAGGSPSIFRSAVMFTCIAIGNSLSKQASIFNSLAASAFLLLCYNPYWLWDAGFQLSYTAVASLALFQQTVYNAISISWQWLDQIWKLTATTIAAQILTLPVTLFLFHQFPVLFLITNIIAIPLSSGILLGEILLCLLSFVPILATPTGTLLSWLIRFMNGIVEKIDELPFASITQINVNLLQVVLLYGAITAAGIWLLHKKKNMVIPALMLLLAYFCIGTAEAFRSRRQQRLVIYQIPKATAIDCIIGNRFVYAGDSSIHQSTQAQLYTFKPARNFFETSRAACLKGVYIDDNLVRIGSLTMIIMDSAFGLPPPPSGPGPAADLLLISHNPPADPHMLLTRVQVRQVVVDGSNAAPLASQWRSVCRKAGIPCHYTPEKGAFVLNAY